MKRKRSLSGRNGGKQEVSVVRKGKLPVLERRKEILDAFRRSDVVILVGDTGSGKTTQVPQMLLDSGWIRDEHLVGITQPRRVAAMSIAARVAAERGGVLGGEVSYAVRFDDCTTKETRLRYVTDGVLLREALQDHILSSYAVVIIDEVHERSINTDVLIGITKRAAEKRKGDLKLVVMSATADAAKMKTFFGRKLKCETLQIPGRLYRVDLLFTEQPVADYLDGAITAALQVHMDEDLPGDILVFLSGQEEIDSAKSILESRVKKLLSSGVKMLKLIVRPLYAALPPQEQLLAIEPLPVGQRHNTRKVLFATNVAETSITIRGVKYVIDTGVAKVRSINRKTGADTLRVAPISKAQARQRGGRAGREGPGKCFRLYGEDAYEKMGDFPVPEILRCDLSASILHLIAMGVHNPLKFDFIDPPPRRAVSNALELLYALSALDEDMNLTTVGKEMSTLPLPPMLARSVLEAKRLACLPQMLSLAAMLSVESPFVTPRGNRDAASASRKRFASPHGDHISLYNAFRSFVKTPKGERDKFCRDYFLNNRSMSSAENVCSQLRDILDVLDTTDQVEPDLEGEVLDSLRKAVVAGYFRNAARYREEDNKYVTIGGGNSLRGGGEVDIHPSSTLRALRRNPTTIIFHEMVVTTKSYARVVLDIDRAWLVEMSKNFYRMEGT